LVELICDNCKKIFNRGYKNRYEHCYCSKECEIEFKHNQFYINKECPICKKIFETREKDQRTYCSIECQIEWQRQNPRTGANHPCYDISINHTLICEWCDKEYETGAYDVKRGRRFCSKQCRREWYAQIWSQTDEWKQNRREWAVDLMENTFMDNPMTSPQLLVNNILNDLKINFINEKGYKNVSVDNYLIDNNLIIEVMGTYWHCDHRKYKIIPYDMQVTRIKMDKIKHSYIKNIEGIEILYLWEKDLLENYNICIKLVSEYIEKDGKLENYHSFNYKIIKDKVLQVKNELPYMDWDIKDLNKIINISVKEKRSKKQLDKWTVFNCEFCGIEKEELTCHYDKSIHHYCSYKCSNEGRKTEKKRSATFFSEIKNN
jgi:hypothetical protein